MNDHEESGGILGEHDEPVSEKQLAREIGLAGVSPEEPRQPASRGRSAGELERLERQIEDAIERRWQSAKDRRLGRLEEELRELKLRLAGDQEPAEAARPAPRASHIVQPGGGGLPPAPDLRGEYEAQVAQLRPGDLAGLLELKRRFRARGLEVY
ncbi:MAG: hypothetical protein KIS80_02525 [Anaerolineales bacterium]|nr:hypothetical protein [Anaerolineales bacterium]